MYKAEYDRSLKKWFACYLDEDGKIDGGIFSGETKEEALVNLGWNLCFQRNQNV